MWPPVSSASSRSRTIWMSSAALGLPASPSRVETESLVHVPARGTARGPRDGRRPESRTPGVLEREAHEPGVHDRAPVVGDGHGAGLDHLADQRQALARAADGDAPDRVDARRPGPQALRRRTKPTAAGSSMGGSVFGMAHTAVKPPAAAAAAPGGDRLLVLAARARAGARARRSGPASRPCRLQSMTRAPRAPRRPPRSRRPSRRRAARRSPSSAWLGSTTRPPRRRSLPAHASPPCLAASAFSGCPPASR